MSNSTSLYTPSTTPVLSSSSLTSSDDFTSSSASIPATTAPTTTTPPPSSAIPSTSATSSSAFATTATSSTSAFSAAPTSTSVTSVATYTSRVTVTPSSGTGSPSVIVITSTETAAVTSSGSSGNLAASASVSASAASAAAASSSSRAAALAASGDSPSSSHGLGSGGKIAIAVVVPIVVIAAIVVGLLFWWKRRKARKVAEEERRKEVEEYGYNPNNDPTLPAVGSTYGETQSEMTEDNSGYRGWGATSSTQRKPSTTLGSGRGPVGMALSDTTSNGGLAQHSEGNSGDPFVSSPTNDRPITGDSDPVGALGGAPVTGTQQDRDINRGPSNASSAYTGKARSEHSDEGDRSPNGAYGSQYYDDGAYYSEAQPHHGPYGDGTYGASQPIIRDVQARRNTRIEKPTVFPQQGNAGISQNF